MRAREISAIETVQTSTTLSVLCETRPRLDKKTVGLPSLSPHPLPQPTMVDIQKVSILGKESIHCGFHLIPYIVQTVLSTLPSSAYVLITDTNVASLHLAAFANEFNSALANSSSRFLSYAVSPGESIKCREGKAEIEDYLLANACTRDTVILALGGGVIGDLVGFVAATL